MTNTTTITNGTPLPDTIRVEERQVDPVALRSIYVSLSFGTFGNRAQADVSEITTDSDIECLTITKKLLVDTKGKPAPELAAVMSADNELKAWLRKRAFMSMFRSGIYRAPYSLLESIDLRFKEHATRRAELVEKLVDAYPDLISQAQLRLRRQWRSDDYMTKDALRASFTMRWNYFILDVPMALAAIRKDLFEDERSKVADTVRDEVESIRLILRGEMKQLVDHMVERLSGVDDKGKPKIFRESMLGNIREFLGLFTARNLTDDSELQTLVQDAQKLLTGVNTDSLRDSSQVRASIRSNFSAIQQTLDGMMQVRPQRSITFED